MHVLADEYVSEEKIHSTQHIVKRVSNLDSVNILDQIILCRGGIHSVL